MTVQKGLFDLESARRLLNKPRGRREMGRQSERKEAREVSGSKDDSRDASGVPRYIKLELNVAAAMRGKKSTSCRPSV